MYVNTSPFRILAFLTILLVPILGTGQSLKAWLAQADTAYAKENYYQAFKYYEVALRYDSNRTDVRYRFAEAARQFNAYTDAMSAYSRVLTSADSARYPRARLWLAEVQNKVGLYAEAKNNFSLFLLRNPAAAAADRAQAEKGIIDADYAINSGVIPVRQMGDGKTPVNMGERINSIYSDFGPFLWRDTLYYTSYQFIEPNDKSKPPKLYNKVVAAPLSGGPMAALPPAFNPPAQHTVYSVFTPDGNGVYYCTCENTTLADLRCDIYFRSRQGNATWGPPLRLSINVPGFTTTQPALGQDPQTGTSSLFFVSDRPGGKGKLDLWWGAIQPNGDVTAATNLTSLNTVEDEVSPFFHQRFGQLYFSSTGRLRFGGFDVYRSAYRNGQWGEPRHLGKNLNSSYDELYYILNPTGDKAYFSSNRWGSTYIEAKKEACCFDIYEQNIDLSIQLKVRTFNRVDSTQLNGVRVSIAEILPNGTTLEVFSQENPTGNEYTYLAERGKKYRITGAKMDFDGDEATVDLTDLADEVTVVEQDLYLNPQLIKLRVLTLCAADPQNLPLPPLNGCTLHFYELTNGDTLRLDKRVNPTGNRFDYEVKLDRTYVLVASRKDFITRTDTLSITREVITTIGRNLTLEMPLRPLTIAELLPLRIYFDNGNPDPRSYSNTTRVDYEESFRTYYAKKQEFIDKYTVGLTGQERFVTAERFSAFFERNVKKGFEDLEVLADLLLERLEEGASYTLELRGFSSPKASPRFNELLSSRRIKSVENYLRKAKSGALVKYLSGGQLKLKPVSFGESQSADKSQELESKDVRFSVYSLKASIERRVEIIGIKIDQRPSQCSDQ